MGNLFLINDSFELSRVEREKRDVVFASFCKVLDISFQNEDKIFGTADLYERQYSYGTFFYDFLYQSWDQVDANPNLNGISSTTHELYISIVFRTPGLVSILSSLEEFQENTKLSHFGFAGFQMETKIVPYVFSYFAYQLWKCPWLVLHQNEIIWKNNINQFLPNLEYSNSILLEEIKSHNKESKLSEYKNNIALTFHEEVMRLKGADIGTYARTIGKKVLEANYYQFDHNLTKVECAASGYKRRSIFKLLNSTESFQYISIDHGHGMFEFHDRRGEHLGEKKFDGSYNSGIDIDHNLRTL